MNNPMLLVVSIGVNPSFKVIFTPLEYVPIVPPLSTYVINVCYFDEVRVQRRNLEPKKWSVFDIVGIYSSGVNMTLKL